MTTTTTTTTTTRKTRTTTAPRLRRTTYAARAPAPPPPPGLWRATLARESRLLIGSFSRAWQLHLACAPQLLEIERMARKLDAKRKTNAKLAKAELKSSMAESEKFVLPSDQDTAEPTGARGDRTSPHTMCHDH